jgi:hypothetical protein
MSFNFRSITPTVVAAADKKPGHSDVVLLATHASIKTWGTVLNDGTPGATRKITTAHGFDPNDGFFMIQCKGKSITPTGDAAGNAGEQVRNLKYEVIIKGDSAIIDEFIDQILNEDLVALFNDPVCGQNNLLQIGSECTPANISGYTFAGGNKGAAGVKEHKFTIECPDRFWYSGEVVRKVEGGQLATPTGLVISAVEDDAYTIGWNAVTGATSYDVQTSKLPTFATGVDTVSSSGITDLTLSRTGQTADTIYYVRVRAVATGKVPSEWALVATKTDEA